MPGWWVVRSARLVMQSCGRAAEVRRRFAALAMRALKELRALPADVARRLVEAARGLGEDPMGGSLPLSGSRFRQVRAGDYRAIIDIDRDAMLVRVLLVAHRRNVYKRLREI